MDIQQLYMLYINDVYRYLLSLCRDKSTAEDLTQDTFMKAYVSLEKSESEMMKSWLFKVAYHTFIDYTRRDKKNSFEEPEYFLSFSHGNVTEKEFEKRIQKQDLYEKLNKLQPLQKRAIILCDLHGFTYKEAASILSLNENTLKSHIFRGRARLRQVYKKGREKE